MQTAAITSRFLIDISSGGDFADLATLTARDSLCQRIVVSEFAHAANSRQVFNWLAQRLIQFAEHSFALRDTNSLQEASLVLLGLPLREAREIGQYYRALAIGRSGKIDESLRAFEAVADSVPLAYTPRALQTLGAIYHVNGLQDEALRFYSEALRAASAKSGPDLVTTLLVGLEISCIKSEIGDHRAALSDLESLAPLMRFVARQHPLYFYFYHNELAVELAALDRLAEAEAACAIALASPFAQAYPEWSQTRDEIEAKRTSTSPSVVAINRATEAIPAPQTQHQCLKPKLATALSWPARPAFQRSIIPIPARVAFQPINILERMLVSAPPRAPPPLS